MKLRYVLVAFALVATAACQSSPTSPDAPRDASTTLLRLDELPPSDTVPSNDTAASGGWAGSGN